MEPIQLFNIIANQTLNPFGNQPHKSLPFKKGENK